MPSFGAQCDNPALGKLLQFKPRRRGLRLKLLPTVRLKTCFLCGHQLALHTIQPDGLLECGIHRCICRIHRWNG
jgi:hypothetical protein